MSFLYKSSNDFDQLMKEINQPDQFQKQEKFNRHDKYALFITNSVYDYDRIGMKSLPHVINDRNTMKTTITKMMDIPEENIFQYDESTHE